MPRPPPATDLEARLQAALAGRYTIERELGHGGLATFYLAHDPKHHRKVAVKVLRPELAAHLQHPNILPLLDSGEADGFYCYVMRYVEGESLRDRLARHGELPVPDAIRRHSRGVVRQVRGHLRLAKTKDSPGAGPVERPAARDRDSRPGPLVQAVARVVSSVVSFPQTMVIQRPASGVLNRSRW